MAESSRASVSPLSTIAAKPSYPPVGVEYSFSIPCHVDDDVLHHEGPGEPLQVGLAALGHHLHPAVGEVLDISIYFENLRDGDDLAPVA